jgi:hypothetical protein
MLEEINPGLPRIYWKQIAKAVYLSLGNAGFDLWASWSMTAPKDRRCRTEDEYWKHWQLSIDEITVDDPYRLLSAMPARFPLVIKNKTMRKEK